MSVLGFSALAASYNKNMHSDKIKLRSFLTTLYFAGDVGVRLKEKWKSLHLSQNGFS